MMSQWPSGYVFVYGARDCSQRQAMILMVFCVLVIQTISL